MAFHVPEASRLPPAAHPLLGTTAADGHNGAFTLPSPEPGWLLFCIASDGEGWEHVSVHAGRGDDIQTASRLRVPTWREMCFVKDQFWDPEDEAIQVHPRRSEYVNLHPHTLHLWRPIGGALLLPPRRLVGNPWAT